jgi:ubiquitin C-terminal hydrolase
MSLSAFGLPNLSTNCYINAALQVLFSLKPVEIIFESFHRDIIRIISNNEFYKPLNLIRQLRTNRKYDTKELMRELITSLRHDNPLMKVTENQQEDSEEFLRNFNNYFNLCLNDLIPTAKPYINLYEIHEINAMRCLNCQNIQKYTNAQTSIIIQAIHNKLEDNLKLYFEQLQIDRRCSKCTSTEMISNTKWSKTPEILIIHIARVTIGEFKNMKPIAIPLLMEMNAKYTLENQSSEYELKSIIFHIGLLKDFGHYTALTKTDNSWNYYNDLQVLKVNPGQMAQYLNNVVDDRTSYILVYSKIMIPRTDKNSYNGKNF